MKPYNAVVSYRDKESGKDVSLGTIDLQQWETVLEAIEVLNADSEGKGEENLLDYAFKAYVIDKQREHRDANRPDRPKTTSNTAKFKQLSPEKQEELLKQAGLI